MWVVQKWKAPAGAAGAANAGGWPQTGEALAAGRDGAGVARRAMGRRSPELSQRAVAAGSPRLSGLCPRGGAGGRELRDGALASRTQ